MWNWCVCHLTRLRVIKKDDKLLLWLGCVMARVWKKWYSNHSSQVTFSWHCDAPLGPVCFHLQTRLSLLQCSLGTWLSPAPPWDLAFTFQMFRYPWRRAYRVPLPEVDLQKMKTLIVQMSSLIERRNVSAIYFWGWSHSFYWTHTWQYFLQK